jgi:archaellum biogenesis ATPase FlaH
VNERKLLAAALKDRKSWQIIKENLTASEISPESTLLLNLCSGYYSADTNAGSVDMEILIGRIEREVTSNKLIAVLKKILADLPDVSAVNLTDEIVAKKRHSLGLQLASKLAAGKAGDDVNALINTYQAMLGTTIGAQSAAIESAITGVSIKHLLSTALNPDHLIKVFPKALNERLDGGVLGGHHLLIFAPTEMGKTLLAINMVAGFLWQKLRVLYIGNEDPAADILLRLGTRLTGLNKYQIRDNPEKAQKLIDSRAGDLFTIAPLSPGTFPEIEALIKKYQPQVLVIDQLRNIDVQSDGRTQALEKAATEARNLAKRYGIVVVSIAQAGDSASGKRVLNRGDVDSSNVGIPGQMDVMIGFGATEEDEANNIRWLSFPKNKRGGGHDPIQVFIDPQLSKVIEA